MIVTLLVAAALALGACGGDDEGSDETTGAATPGITTNTDPGTNGTTETERTTTTDEDRTTRERGDDRGGRDRSGSGGGGGSNGGGSNGGGAGGGGSNDEGSTAQPPAQPGDVQRTARTVCSNFLPKQISNDLAKEKRDPEDVARDYSRGFPERQRKRAYDGCLAGLKSR
jgi:hypothetical protein